MPNYQGVWSLSEQYQNAAAWQADNPLPLSGDIALSAGGYSGGFLSAIESVQITTLGGSQDFGDLTVGQYKQSAFSSTTRGVFANGYQNGYTNNINEYVTILSRGNSIDFGDLSVARTNAASVGSSTRGVVAGGLSAYPSNNQDVIDYFTTATTGNATDFGDLTLGRWDLGSTCSSTRGVYLGGRRNVGGTNSYHNTMDYITIASTGNATDFGDTTVTTNNTGSGLATSGTRGMRIGGTNVNNKSNIVGYITIASTGNETDFGDLSAARESMAVASNTSRALSMGGDGASSVSTIEYFTIATTGNATSFGDLLAAPYDNAGCSNAHGGLS